MENICEVKNIDGEEWIVFNDSFNEKLSPQILDLLSRYKKVQFGTSYNQQIDNLPNSLTDLKLGKNFNQPVDISDEDSPT